MVKKVYYGKHYQFIKIIIHLPGQCNDYYPSYYAVFKQKVTA